MRAYPGCEEPWSGGACASRGSLDIFLLSRARTSAELSRAAPDEPGFKPFNGGSARVARLR